MKMGTVITNDTYQGGAYNLINKPLTSVRLFEVDPSDDTEIAEIALKSITWNTDHGTNNYKSFTASASRLVTTIVPDGGQQNAKITASNTVKSIKSS
ncbi:MAG: hypothetical protein ACOX2I_04105 [Candidatus Ozemobacteraceae bacterium]